MRTNYIKENTQKNRLKLLLKGIGLNDLAQSEFNAENYKDATQLKKEAVVILDGFSDKEIQKGLSLLGK